MTREEAKKLMPVITAFANGKMVEYYDGASWLELRYPEWNLPTERYRIYPEPKLRPWTAEEVPVGAVVRAINNRGGGRWLITGIGDDGGEIGISFTRRNKSELADMFEFSTDGGKTWHPCGVIEGGAK